MKKSFKKTVTIGLAAILAAASFTGCQKKAANNSGEGDVPTLLIYMPGEGYTDLASVTEKINEITVPSIGAKVNLQFTGGFAEKMNMKMAAGEVFDICFTGYNNPYRKAVRNGGLMPLKELIDENVPELWDLMPEFWWDSVKVDDEIYAVPNQQIAALRAAIIMPKEYADQYGISEENIKHINDIEPYLAKMKEDYPDKYAFRTRESLELWTKYKYEIVSTQLAIERGDQKAQVIPIYETPEYEEAVRKLSEWFKKGYIRPDVASVINDDPDFNAHKYIVTKTGYKPGLEINQSAMVGGEHVAISLEEPIVTTAGCVATMYGISATAEHPVESIKFIHAVNSNKELYNLICYGIEGKHYEKLDETHVRPYKDAGYYPNASWRFGNQFNAYLLEGQQDDLWEATIKVNDEAEKSVLLGFDFDTESVVTEISQCTNVISEFAALGNGSTDWEKMLPEYKNRMEQAGIRKIQAELQKQIDEFLADKN